MRDVSRETSGGVAGIGRGAVSSQLKRGRLEGRPTRRGKRSPQRPSAWRTARWTRPTGARTAVWLTSLRPSTARPSGAHRSSGSLTSGGSVTMTVAPSRRRGAAHSAVTAGRPKLRAVTNQARWRHGPRPTSSARWARTVTRAANPSRGETEPSQLDRRRLASTNSHRDSGQAVANTSPGIPPPVPKSTHSRSPGASMAEVIARARANWSSTGPGPKKPSSFASSRTSTR
jgi:hypothetical protein